ncbi:hypothetical protein [Dyadobacter sediminis]|uniref:Uncharacterized protein n=1 Tax=Dyadobacter sediminis TaxID=1493691 RepID=A0A5R9KB17_9BACT|nr:hypothetical protein [Dyadobacter sediminis]TLU92020.1 hypothetical protein FEM55_14770 [Dyadobacter sediminis]
MNPVSDPEQPGSAWWRAINGHFIYHGVLAELLYENNVKPQEVKTVSSLWLEYMYKPSAQAWYAAHNASITCGYLQFSELAAKESVYEQSFIKEVLIRLYYAQVLIMGKFLGSVKVKNIFSNFARVLVKDMILDLEKIEEFLADPKYNSVDLLVQLPDFYPDHYPLFKSDIDNILFKNKDSCIMDWMAWFFDEDMIGWHLTPVFDYVSQWILFPEVKNMIVDNKVNYPHAGNPYTINCCCYE